MLVAETAILNIVFRSTTVPLFGSNWFDLRPCTRKYGILYSLELFHLYAIKEDLFQLGEQGANFMSGICDLCGFLRLVEFFYCAFYTLNLAKIYGVIHCKVRLFLNLKICGTRVSVRLQTVSGYETIYI